MKEIYPLSRFLFSNRESIINERIEVSDTGLVIVKKFVVEFFDFNT